MMLKLLRCLKQDDWRVVNNGNVAKEDGTYFYCFELRFPPPTKDIKAPKAQNCRNQRNTAAGGAMTVRPSCGTRPIASHKFTPPKFPNSQAIRVGQHTRSCLHCLVSNNRLLD
eukprot:4270773-Amphidinium_carterae.1